MCFGERVLLTLISKWGKILRFLGQSGGCPAIVEAVAAFVENALDDTLARGWEVAIFYWWAMASTAKV